MTWPASSASTARRILRGSGGTGLISRSMVMRRRSLVLDFELEHANPAGRELHGGAAAVVAKHRAIEQVRREAGSDGIEARRDAGFGCVDGEEHARCSALVTMQGDANVVRLARELRELELALCAGDRALDGLLVEGQERR